MRLSSVLRPDVGTCAHDYGRLTEADSEADTGG